MNFVLRISFFRILFFRISLFRIFVDLKAIKLPTSRPKIIRAVGFSFDFLLHVIVHSYVTRKFEWHVHTCPHTESEI